MQTHILTWIFRYVTLQAANTHPDTNLLSYVTLKAANTYPDTNLLSYVTLKAANTHPDTNLLSYVTLKATNTYPDTNLLPFVTLKAAETHPDTNFQEGALTCAVFWPLWQTWLHSAQWAPALPAATQQAGTPVNSDGEADQAQNQSLFSHTVFSSI